MCLDFKDKEITISTNEKDGFIKVWRAVKENRHLKKYKGCYKHFIFRAGVNQAHCVDIQDDCYSWYRSGFHSSATDRIRREKTIGRHSPDKIIFVQAWVPVETLTATGYQWGIHMYVSSVVIMPAFGKTTLSLKEAKKKYEQWQKKQTG